MEQVGYTIDQCGGACVGCGGGRALLVRLQLQGAKQIESGVSVEDARTLAALADSGPRLFCAADPRTSAWAASGWG